MIREAWIRMRGRYKDVIELPLPPVRFAIYHMTAEQVDLYRPVPSPGHLISLGVYPFTVDDYVHEDEDITCAVLRLHLNSSDGLSGIRTEHLCQWLHEETRDEASGATNCHKVFEIVQAEFHDENMANKNNC